METEERLGLSLIGIDPGSVNLGVGGIRFFGLVDLVNDNGEVIEVLPDVEIITMERWDLERGIVHCPTKSVNRLQKIPLSNHKERSKKMIDWSDSATQAITRSNWMFQDFTSLLTEERLLPFLVIENQCDQHKTGYNKNEMTQIQSIITASLQAIEYRDRWLGREGTNKRLYYQGMRKYGQRSDASRDRPERKEKGVDDLKELLSKLNTINSLRWLSYLNRLELEKEQIHDMCDGVLLAIDKALALYEEHLKNLKAQSSDKKDKEKIQKERKRIPLVPTQKRSSKEPSFTDDNLPTEDDYISSSSKKKSSLAGKKEKVVRKKKSKVVEQISPENTKKRKRTNANKEKTEVEPKPKRAYKKRAKKDDGEYPKLLLDITTTD